MNKILVVCLGLACAMVLTAKAAPGDEPSKGGKKAENTVRKELVTKYDTNKDGKLDKAERASMTADDKEKWAQSMGHKKGAAKNEKKEQKN